MYCKVLYFILYLQSHSVNKNIKTSKMKTFRIFLVASSMIIALLVTNNLIGSTQTITTTKWIVPAKIINCDTIPVINYPAVIIIGNRNN